MASFFRCRYANCLQEADDAYWGHDEKGRYVMWPVCDRHCILAIEMVESVSEVIEHEGEFK